MRKKLSIQHDKSLFGHTYTLVQGDLSVEIIKNMDSDFKKNSSRITKNYYWFRAPKISQDALMESMQGLCYMEGKHQLEVWATVHENQAPQFDASLKLVDDVDAASWAWSYTDVWMKWDDAAEKEFKEGLKPQKGLKVYTDKDGNLKVKGKVTVTELSDP
jgi:hypothetical protein